MVQNMRLADPLGGAPLAAVGVLLLRGERKGRVGKEKMRKGREGGVGKDKLHITLSRPCQSQTN